MEYAVVDIETTGSYTGADRITEIAILIHNGKKVIDRFQSLINPEAYIPAWISSLTGITNEMVATAPRFFEIAKEVYQILDGKIFVAHNVNFDYNFIRQEFRSLGGDFNAKKLCTVRLSRKIFPGYPSYSLGNLCQHLKIKIKDRHRAFGDAEATAKILGLLIRNDKEGHIPNALKRSSGEAYLPPNLLKAQFDTLPEEAGVYYFLDSRGKVIYVGKANNIKARVKGHFTPGSETTQKRRMMEEIHNISYELCGNELVSLLFEANEIKRLWPAYNRSLKVSSLNYGIFLYEDRRGYKRFSISRISKEDKPVASFRNMPEAREFMLRKTSEYSLCPKLTGLQTSEGACFDYRIRQCDGACIGKEKPKSYNKRVNEVLKTVSTSNISAAIIGKGRNAEESTVVWIENGIYKGFGFFDNSMNINDPWSLKNCIKSYPDNQDIQRIIQVYLRRDRQYQIVPITQTQADIF
jgi:DNA polymerase-3 subunit epsilon